jgi:hypothetical protein
LGEQIYVTWAFPFMVLGFFLTVALIGAVVIARREEGEGPEPASSGAALPEPSYTDSTPSPGGPRHLAPAARRSEQETRS